MDSSLRQISEGGSRRRVASPSRGLPTEPPGSGADPSQAAGNNRSWTPPGPYDWGTWEIGTKGVYFIRRERPNPIVLQRFGSGETVTRHEIEKDRQISYSTPALTVSQDERTVLFAKVRQSEDEIMWVDLW